MEPAYLRRRVGAHVDGGVPSAVGEWRQVAVPVGQQVGGGGQLVGAVAVEQGDVVAGVERGPGHAVPDEVGASDDQDPRAGRVATWTVMSTKPWPVTSTRAAA